MKPLEIVREIYEEELREAPASTQIIIRASPESDKTILTLASELYQKKLRGASTIQPIFQSTRIETFPPLKNLLSSENTASIRQIGF